MSDPFVTIIIPCRNYGRYLADTLNSALTQTVQDIEILLFNDDSTDETDQIAREYCADQRIAYIRQVRRGLAGTRNVGLQRARGRYIQFLDADDMMLPTKLARQCGVLDQEPSISATYAPHITIDALGDQTDDPIPWRPISDDEPLGDLIIQWDRDLHIPPVSFLFRREHLDELVFDEALATHEEWDFYLRLVARGGQLRATHEPLAVYRRHAGSLSTNKLNMEAGRRQVLEKVARWGGTAGQHAERLLLEQEATTHPISGGEADRG